MSRKSLAAGCLLLAALVQGRRRQMFISESQEDKLSQELLDLQPHSLTTQDGYVLTLHHVLSVRDEYKVEDTNHVVLLQHSSSMDGLSWFDTDNESLPSLLIKNGFDVWLGNDRGTKNSQDNTSLDPIVKQAEFWDYSYAELGELDAPANLNFIRDQTVGKPLTFIGYGQAAASILYGMTRDESKQFLSLLVNSVVLLAPCVYLSEPFIENSAGKVQMAEPMYKSYERIFDLYDQIGVHAYSGPNASVDKNKVCEVFGEKNPECWRTRNPAGFGQPFSVKSQKHMQQNMIEGRFQEYSDTYAVYGQKKNEQRQTNQFDLKDVEVVAPLYIFTAGKDNQCPQNKAILSQQFRQPSPPHKEFPDWTHTDFVKGKHLDQLIKDIAELTIRKRAQEQDEKISSLYAGATATEL